MGARRGGLLWGAAVLVACGLLAALLVTPDDPARAARRAAERRSPARIAVPDARDAGEAPASEAETATGEPTAAGEAPAGPTAFVLPGVEGIVHVPDGCYAVDARLELEPPIPATLPNPGVDGRFLLPHLPAGSYRLSATHPECYPVAVALEVAPEREAPRPELFLRRGGSLRVVVRGVRGVPIPHQRIEVRASGSVKVSGTPPLRAATTDDAGTAVFEHLAPGSYEVNRVEPDRREEAGIEGQLRMASIEPEAEAEIVFQLGCRLEGLMVGPDGRALAGAYVRLLPAEWGPEGYRHESTKTDDNGAFVLDDFPPGAYVIMIQVVGRPSYVTTAARLEFAEGQVRAETIRIRPTLLRGRIRLAVEEGAPAPELPRGSSLQVQARRVEVEGGRVVRTGANVGTAYARDEGRFELIGLEPGWYSLWFPAPAMGWADVTLLVDFTAGGTLDDLDVELPARATAVLVLRVLEPDGGPATGVDFSLSTGGDGSRTLFASGAGRGRWRLPVPAGEQVVFVHRPGFLARVEIDLAADGEAAREVTLRPTGE